MKKLGLVSQKELEEITDLHEKRYALINLNKIIDDKNKKNAIRDLEIIQIEYDKWWECIFKDYAWNIDIQQKELMVSFEDAAIYIMDT